MKKYSCSRCHFSTTNKTAIRYHQQKHLPDILTPNSVNWTESVTQ